MVRERAVICSMFELLHWKFVFNNCNANASMYIAKIDLELENAGRNQIRLAALNKTYLVYYLTRDGE